MTSQVAICNLALSNLGKANISSLDEASAEAKACKQFYEHTLNTILQGYPWLFARKTAALAKVTNTKSNRWLYAYSRPVDCLKIVRIVGELGLDYLRYDKASTKTGGHDYTIEGDLIYTGIDPAYLEYTQEFTDPTKFPPLFVDALSWALSARLAMPLTRDPKLRADALQMARMAHDEAAASDANEVRNVSDSPAEWNEIREPDYLTNRKVRDV